MKKLPGYEKLPPLQDRESVLIWIEHVATEFAAGNIQTDDAHVIVGLLKIHADVYTADRIQKKLDDLYDKLDEDDDKPWK